MDIFQISTVQSLDCRNLKDEQKRIKNEELVVNQRNLHSFEYFWSEIYGQKVLNI